MKNSGLEIRRYEKGDEDAVFNLHIKALKPTGSYIDSGEWNADFSDIESIYIKPGGEFLVGTIDGEIVAIGALKKVSTDHAEIKRMRVDPLFQRRGFGQEILTKLEHRAKELGFNCLELDTGVIQEAAQKLYEKNGFKEFKRGELTWWNSMYLLQKNALKRPHPNPLLAKERE